MAERSIRSRLRLLVFGVALPLVALAALTIWTLYTSGRESAESRTTEVATLTANAIAQYLANAEELGLRLAGHPTLHEFEPASCRELVTTVVEISGQVVNVVVTRADGSLVCAVVEPQDEMPPPIRDWVAVQSALETGEITLRSPLRGQLTGEIIAPLVVPVLRDGGRVVGAVAISLGLDYLQDQVARSSLPEGWLLTVTDTAYVVVARSEEPERWILDTLPTPEDPDERADVTRDSGFNTTEGADGVRRLFAYDRIDGAPWIVWAGVPTDVVFAPLRAALYPMLGLAALTLFFVVVFARRTGGRIGSSLAELSAQMQAADRALDGHVAEDGPAEIADVARQYNQLLRTRRVAEAEAAASADLNEMVMRATNDALWDWHLDTDEIQVNGRFVEMFGAPANEGGVDFWVSRVHPGDVSELRSRIESLGDLRTTSWSAEYRMRRSDGDWAEVLDRCHAIRGPAGEIVRVVGAIMDMTEARRARRATEKAKERYRSVLRNAAFGIGISTLEGQILEINPALLRMLGAEKDQALGLNEADFYLDPAEREREVADVLKRREVGPLETTWKTVGGAPINVRLFRTLFIDESGDVALEVIAEDRTERTRLEEQFRQAQKMEAVGQLAGGVAHDFNNRLTVIQGRAQLIRASVGQDPELIENVEAILESASGAARLTKELLAVSRKQLYQPKLLSLTEVVHRLAPTFSTLLGEQYRLQAESDEAELPPVLADPGHLQQILMNLLVNARDAQPGGGVVRVRTGRRAVGDGEARQHLEVGPGEYVYLAIVDTGTGIPPEVMERVYEPFFTTKPVGVGTGLGLATVYGLVSQNGGFVTMDSKVGDGTTVTVYLPVSTGDAEGVEGIRHDHIVPQGNGAAVLVVEDEEGVRSVVARTLRVLDYEVIEAESAEEALALPEETLAGLAAVVSDIVMPQMRGTELADRLQERYPGLPILFISGYRHDTSLDLSPPRLRDFLAKPFSPQALGITLARLVSDSTDGQPDEA